MAKLNFLLLCLGLAIGAGACEPADPPADPSFKTDVLPLMQGHCVRCHGANNTLNADPLSQAKPTAYNVAPETGFFDHYEDRMMGEGGCSMPRCTGAASSVLQIQLFIHAASTTRMPPLPAEGLSEWELKLLDNWTGTLAKPKMPPKP
ncbi:MAG TPA: hypothetical protein VH374_21265 [Polyangia bacterium]|jgi:hypothetical protein|nr:hypothetical protein [Polyangia bacterium]